ncbi:hypothetical protein AB0M20_12085 [Actinoplanes sp. NPDC051633]|uniref:hypothetical protein n=1 Tax=Actinoplanes sp. NPDC051633 TaxID=3155670 RepID=UPI0034371DD8
MTRTQALRLRGRGDRIRLYHTGTWNHAPLDDLAVTCRTTTAVDKALAEAISAARRAGHSWPEIASVLGLSPTLSTWDEIATELAATRRHIWDRRTPRD